MNLEEQINELKNIKEAANSFCPDISEIKAKSPEELCKEFEKVGDAEKMAKEIGEAYDKYAKAILKHATNEQVIVLRAKQVERIMNSDDNEIVIDDASILAYSTTFNKKDWTKLSEQIVKNNEDISEKNINIKFLKLINEENEIRDTETQSQ